MRLATRREMIEGAIEDVVAELLFDVEGTRSISAGDIEEAIDLGEITVDDMVEVFRDGLKKWAGQ